MTALNSAMSHIQDENRYYNSRLFEKYFKSAGANAFLASDEVAWLKAHGTVRVGYLDNYLAFCARDPATGALTGALKDFLAAASDCMVNGSIDFQATAYPTSEAAQAALRAGEVDCIFPSSLSSYDGEKLDMLMTPPLMRTDIYAVVRLTDQGFFSNKEHVVVAVNEGNTNYDAFRVYVDALTSVKNKGAFTTAVDGIQSQMDSGVDDVDFAIGMFDCNDLKRINDEFGHDRGDTYLKAACRLICRIFQHSPVFRIGGDEFAVILRNSDFENRQQLVNEFEASVKANNASVNNRWEEIHIAMGIAVYDPDLDQSALDVVRRADGIMYSNKRNQKEQNA